MLANTATVKADLAFQSLSVFDNNRAPLQSYIYATHEDWDGKGKSVN